MAPLLCGHDIGVHDTLFVTDLDGTLLDATGHVGAYSAAVLERVAGVGAWVTCATARSWTTTRRLVGGYFQLPVVVHNGAATVRPADGAVQSAAFLRPTTVDRVLGACRRAGAPPLVHTLHSGSEQTAWLQHEASVHVNQYWLDRGADPRSAPQPSWASLPRDHVLGVAVVAERARVQRVQGVLGEVDGAQVLVRPDTYRTGPVWLEVTAAGVSKGGAVRQLADQLGASRVVVFGDSVNDLPLFAVADESYAVAGADPQVLACASGVIGSNEDEAVARWLARVVLAEV